MRIPVKQLGRREGFAVTTLTNSIKPSLLFSDSDLLCITSVSIPYSEYFKMYTLESRIGTYIIRTIGSVQKTLISSVSARM